MDSPGNDVEVNVVVGREGPESLRDAAQAQPLSLLPISEPPCPSVGAEAGFCWK